VTRKTISRRSILVGAALTAFAGAEAAHLYTERARRRLVRQLIAYFATTYELLPLGRAYLDSPASPGDLSATVAALERRLVLTSYDLASATQAVQTTVDLDFDRGDLVEVRGWLLPRTIALLAAADIQEKQSLGMPKAFDI
jgi:hypothetical protein